MQRISVNERPELMRAASEHGLEYSASDGITGWDESVYYQFSTREIEEDLEGPTE
jgi:glutathionylspermidine synthase